MGTFTPNPVTITFKKPTVVNQLVSIHASAPLLHTPSIPNHDYTFASAGTPIPIGAVDSEWFEIIPDPDANPKGAYEGDFDELLIKFDFEKPPAHHISRALTRGNSLTFSLPVDVENNLSVDLQIILSPTLP